MSTKSNEPATEQRKISTSSMLSDSVDSAGGGLVLCSNEIPTKAMVDEFMTRAMEVWGGLALIKFLPEGRRSLSLQYSWYL
jgi:hypothetical protein